METTANASLENGPEETAIAEAAVWLSRLRSDRRSARTEADFRAWLEQSPQHRSAFEAVNETWDLAGGVSPPRRRRVARGARRPLALAAALLFATVAGVVLWTLRPQPIETAVGELRSLKLEDGTAIVVNTDTRLHTRFTDTRRLIILEHGEAAFEVSRDSLRPFVVQAGGARVVAVGTAFDVRWTNGHLAVTLSEGKVRVVDERAEAMDAAIELSPGQRLARGAVDAAPTVREIDLKAARAWQRGQLIFQRTPLVQALAEMNRYSEQKLTVDAAAEQLLISGAFRAGDAAKFARALEDLYGLKVHLRDEYLHLSGPDPREPPSSGADGR